MKLKLLILVFALALGLAGCGGGGGGGSSGESTTDVNSQFVTQITALDQSALSGGLTDEQYLTSYEQILTNIDAESTGAQDLESYLETHVLGVPLNSSSLSARSSVNRAAISDTITRIRNSETYQMIEIFITSVASNLLLPDPASMLLDLAQPEVFTSIASVQVRTHIMDAQFSGQISADTAADLVGRIQRNPFEAESHLLAAKGETVPEWLPPFEGECLRDCGSPGDTAIYSGSFSGTMTESGGGCVWQHAVSGTIEVVVTGSGTLADPYEGTFDVSGSATISLVSGVGCDAGGNVSISVFNGSVSGTSGKLNASGSGTIGTSPFTAALSNADVSTSTVTGSFVFDGGVDNTINQSVTLSRQP
ncbi:MAG: hypothetical protein M0036_24670 [Desulfobacteraceae bacterium]|nr:hypothetical protein [Desulfobacteraceae bacterium]